MGGNSEGKKEGGTGSPEDVTGNGIFGWSHGLTHPAAQIPGADVEELADDVAVLVGVVRDEGNGGNAPPAAAAAIRAAADGDACELN